MWFPSTHARCWQSLGHRTGSQLLLAPTRTCWQSCGCRTGSQLLLAAQATCWQSECLVYCRVPHIGNVAMRITLCVLFKGRS